MQKSYLGIDVSKLSFDLSVLMVKDGVKKDMFTTKFENNADGLKAFKKYLVDNGVAFNENSLLVIENTGIYHRLIWQFCSEHSLPIYIGNAADLKWSFGIARIKNDKVDSMRLCDYAYKNREDLKPTPAINKNFIILKDLLTNRTKLVRQQNAIRQTIKELKISNDKATQKLLEDINKAAIDGLKKSIKLIEAQMRKMVKADPEVLANYTLMISVTNKGIAASRTLLSSAASSYQLRFRQDKHIWAFGCYLILLYLYLSAVGGRHSNEFPACSNTRPLHAIFSDTLRTLKQTK